MPYERILASLRRTAPAGLAVALALALAPPAHADIDVRLDLGNAPEPPSFAFVAPPHRVYDSTSGVYVIDDADVGDVDLFQVGGTYYLFDEGFWYRSSDWRDDFSVVAPQDVPGALYNVSVDLWKHHPSYDSVYGRGIRSRPRVAATPWTTTREEVTPLPTPAPAPDWRTRSYQARSWNDRSWRQSQSERTGRRASRDDRWRGPDVNASQTRVTQRHVVRRTVHVDGGD